MSKGSKILKKGLKMRIKFLFIFLICGFFTQVHAGPTMDERVAIERVEKAVSQTLAADTGSTKVIWNLILQGKIQNKGENLKFNSQKMSDADWEKYDIATDTTAYLRCMKETDLYKSLTLKERKQYDKNCPSDFVKLAAHSSMTQTANCGEHAGYVYIGLHIMKTYLAMKGIQVFEKFYQAELVPGDHVFVVVGFADKSSVGLIDTWAGKKVLKTAMEFQVQEGRGGIGFYQTNVIPKFQPNPYLKSASRIHPVDGWPLGFDPRNKSHILAYNEGFNLLTRQELREYLAKMK
jgi:hypothetical protein